MRFLFTFGLLPLFLVLTTGWSFAQNAPITTAATVGGALPGSTITVPVTVVNFTNIGAISLSLDYDYSVLHFISGTPNPSLQSLTAFDNDLGNGYHRLIIGWFSTCSTLTNGSNLVTLSFTYISGSTTLNWYDNSASCEYADCGNNALNDSPQSTYYINGLVCGVLQSPGSINGENSVCSGETGVYYSIAPVSGASGYVWAVPPGAVITGGGNTPWIDVDYPAGASSGNVTVAGTNACGTGAVSQLAVAVNPLPVANAGNDTTIAYGTSTTLHAASGGTGSFAYSWTPDYLLVDPNVQDPQTLNLTSTNIFTVTVTNTTSLCVNNDDVVVAVSGGPLNVNPEADPGIVCQGNSSQLYANAGGGSGNYTYQWSCIPAGNPPWSSALANPLVTPDTTTTYYLTLYDGFNSILGTVVIAVTPLPHTPVINQVQNTLTSDTCCGNQWYLNGSPIQGATGQVYTTSFSGQFFDIVTINNCSSDTSNILDVITNIPITMQSPIEAFPNPARDFLMIDTKERKIQEIFLFSAQGATVVQKNIEASDPSRTFEIDVRNMAPGIYILKVVSEMASFTQRVLIW